MDISIPYFYKNLPDEAAQRLVKTARTKWRNVISFYKLFIYFFFWEL